MTNEAMSPLRRRMIEDMTIRNFGPKTQHDYVRSVRNLTVFLGRSPDTASNEDVRRFQLHLASDGISAASMNSTVSGLRFFFRVTLGRSNIASHLPFVRQPHKLPIVLSPEEVSRFLEAAPGLKYKAAFSVAYGAGLRASEVTSLTTRQLNRACHAAAQMAELEKPVSLHTLRHSFATHLLEQNVDIRVIQVLLGHAKLDTTALYTQVATKTIRQVTSPLDQLIRKSKTSAPPT